MSWLGPLLDIIHELDQAVDQTAQRFHEHVTPVVQRAAQRLDHFLEEAGEQLIQGMRSRTSDLDQRYQGFIAAHLDPLLGQQDGEPLAALVAAQPSPPEASLNRRIGFSALVLLVVTAGAVLYPPSWLITIPLAFATTLPTYSAAYQSVKEQRTVTYQSVSAVNVTWIWLGGFYIPAMVAALLFLLGEKLLLLTEERTRKELTALFAEQPQSVWLIRDGIEVSLPFTDIVPGDVVVVDAGGFMPVDGTVLRGMALIDQQVLTGEARPVDKGPGDAVFAATLVCSGRLYVRVEKAGRETVSGQLGRLLERTASYRLALQAKGNQLANRFAVPTLALSGLAVATRGMQSGLAILNSAFGISLRVSAPITMLNLLHIAAEKGILLKDGRSLALLSEVDTVLFDKTGTLTLAQPTVVAIHVLGAFAETELLTFAAAAEHRQTHPIAAAILAEAQRRGIVLPDPELASYEVGYGIKVALGEHTVQVGSDRFMALTGVALSAQLQAYQAACHERGHSLILIAVDGRLAGAIELEPTLRPEAAAAIDALHRRGLRTVIVSGDQEEPTRRLASKLGIERYFANVLPDGKARLLAELQADGHAVCFVGDGLNDAIALQRANVSVSLEGATTAATDRAQVILMQRSLQQLPCLFELADQLERSLQAAYAADLVPGTLNVAGVLLLGWGFYPAILLSMTSMAAGLGIAMRPLFVHRRRLNRAAAASHDVGALPQPAVTAQVRETA